MNLSGFFDNIEGKNRWKVAEKKGSRRIPVALQSGFGAVFIGSAITEELQNLGFS